MDEPIDFKDAFNGFQNTALLWNSSPIFGLEQFYLDPTNQTFIQNSEYKKLRLGKWVEKFVGFQLRQKNSINILEENLVITNDKQTIGELDVLLLKDQQPIHLEIIYKFYLYDTLKQHKNPLDYWIGPNRNDSLIYKLQKLKEKQLPLLYHSKTLEALNRHQLHPNDFIQQVCFKAQLFLSYDTQNLDVNPLNSDCILGWHLNFNRLAELGSYQFYIPSKLEWLCIPNNKVNWLSFMDAKPEIETYIFSNRSPLCWLKNDTNELKKCFITWW